MIAPGFFSEPIGGQEVYAQIFPVLRANGFNTLMGPGYVDKVNALCNELPESYACDFASGLAYEGLQLSSLKSLEYFSQVSEVERYQKYIKDYATAESIESDLVLPGIAEIDSVPIQFLMAQSDQTNTVDNAKKLSEQIKSIVSFDILPDPEYNHATFESLNSEEYIDELVR